MITNVFDVIYNPINIEVSIVNSCVADSSGAYYSGMSIDGTNKWTVIKVDVNTGAVIWSQTPSIVGSNYPALNAIAIDSTGVYIGGSRESGVNVRIEKRSLTEGSILWEKEVQVGTGATPLKDIFIDTTGLYAVLDETGGTNNRRIQKINLSTGIVIWDKIFNIMIDSNQVSYSGNIDDTGIYLIFRGLVDGASIIEKRNKDTLVLIWSKTLKDGVEYTSMSAGLALDSKGVYIAGNVTLVSPTYALVYKLDLLNGSELWKTQIKPGVNCGVNNIIVGQDSLFVVGQQSTVPSYFYIVELLTKTGAIIHEEKELIRSSSCKAVFYVNYKIYVGGWMKVGADNRWLLLSYNVDIVVVTYTTLAKIPITSFQAILNKENEDYLSASIPDGARAIAALGDLTGKQMVIKKGGKSKTDGTPVIFEIQRGEIRQVRLVRYSGAEIATIYAYRNAAPTVTPIGYKLNNVTYEADYKGKKDVRGVIDKGIKVGDNIELPSGFTFVIGKINYTVSGVGSIMSISEA